MPVFQLTDALLFPPPQLARADGLLAVGGDLSPERLLLAYQLGIFPWYSDGDPILWWAPSPRLILVPTEFKTSRRLAREIRKGLFSITVDQAFREVIKACAGVRQETWITSEMIEAYTTLHKLGFVHSVECWRDGHLAGGLYGVSLGAVFFGESMFSRVSNSSKIALAFLVDCLRIWDYKLIDCQMQTAHLQQFGAREIPGEDFIRLLKEHISGPGDHGRWGSTVLSSLP